MSGQYEYKVYAFDDYGSEFLDRTIYADSLSHAMDIVSDMGIENLSGVVPKDPVLSAHVDVSTPEPERDYKIYVTDIDGSERLGCTVSATSIKHAKQIAKAMGIDNITDVVEKD